MRTLGFILASGAVCLLLAGSALATPTGWITMSFAGVSPGEGVSTTMGGTTAGVYNQRVYLDSTKWGDLLDGPDPDTIPDQEASQLIGSLGSADGGTGTARWAYASTFCADFRQYASGSWLKYYIYEPEDAPIGGGNTPMGDAKAADLRRLFDNYSAYGLGTPYTYGGTTYVANQTSAAFQASVWEIIYGTKPYDVTADTFRVTSGNSWKVLSNYWLANLGTVDPCLGLRILVRDDQQDFAIVVPGIGRDPIPEPVTMAGLMLGIGSIAGYVRRRRTA